MWFTNRDPHLDRHFFLLAVMFYGVSALYSVFLWRKGFRQDNWINYCLLLGAFCLHTTAMALRGFDLKHCPVNNLYEATTFIAWGIVAAYLVFGLWSRLRFLGAFAAPVLLGMGIFALMPELDKHAETPQFTGGPTSLHAALALLAYGAFGLAAVAGLMFLSQEHNLKFHKLRAMLSFFPPIQKLEVIAGRLLLTGFILLTVSLAVGGHIAHEENKPIFNDPKVPWALLLWAIYLGLLVSRWRFAQSGRRFAIGVIVVFAFLVLTFWGTTLLSPLHHQ